MVVSKAELELRLIETERAMVRFVSPAKVHEHLSKKYGVRPRTVKKWMTTVRKRWAEDIAEVTASMPEVRQHRRDQARQILYDVINQSNRAHTKMRDKTGRLILDDNGIPLVEHKPDLRAILGATSQLRELDALDMPKTAHLLVAAKTTTESKWSDEEMEFYFETSRWPTAGELEEWLRAKRST